ncbi:hypothetical protein CTZ44_21030 [Salmonella enterica]|nr:hypothetical protein [Salmonella enterica subsp. enterica serovar Tennessee]EGX0284029.1 hypothetical protein [Salmonella enterica]EIQ2295847.1 hypothetical protein [Salmonella enterica subsp. enterica serovar Newport]HCB4994119.1 hypothetical protein [Salmonella enterica subsp. enterica serovar Bredeney]
MSFDIKELTEIDLESADFSDALSETFASLPCIEQSRLREQATYMADYQDVLIRRVIAFS